MRYLYIAKFCKHDFERYTAMQITKKNICFIVAILFSALATAQSQYYTSVDGVAGGATLKNALYNLIKVHERISYGSGTASTWGAFYSTDRNPATNQVYDMYSSEVRYFGDKGSAISGMNIEHSLPKSWWGGTKNDAYCDLHHLNPSDQNANSRKGNFPLAELESVSWDNGVTYVGKATINGSSVSAFEPCDEYKGDFARTYMYMFTCYQNLSFEYTWMNYENSAYPTLRPWAVELLLKWNKQDPVSQKEIDRNNAVYEIQGNRNPYIDYPQLAEYVWGDSVNYTFNLDGAVTGGGTPVVDANTTVHIMEAFSSDLGQFTAVEAVGSYPWAVKYGVACVSSYESSVNHAAESWLISAPIDFSNAGEAVISFEYVTRYNESGKLAERNQLLISDNYTGDVATASWEVIDFSIVQNSTDWTYTSTGEVAIPAEFLGKEGVTVAFKYVGTESKAGTWQLKNVILTSKKGENDGGDDNTGDDTDDGDDNTGDDNTGSAGNGGNYPFDKFTLVTDASTLTVGDSIIIAYTDIVMGAQSESGKFRTSVQGAVIEAGAITSYPEGTQKIVLEEGSVDGTFAFNADGLYLAAASSSSNYIYSNNEISDDASWLIDIAADGAVVTAQGAFTRNILQYNTSSPRFSCYKGTQKSVTIYAKSPVSTTSVEEVLVEAATAVDVYTLQGVKVRAAANPSAALEGLPGGFYIVSGKKVYKK